MQGSVGKFLGSLQTLNPLTPACQTWQAVDSMQASLDGLVQLSKLAWGTPEVPCPAHAAGHRAAPAVTANGPPRACANGSGSGHGSAAEAPMKEGHGNQGAPPGGLGAGGNGLGPAGSPDPSPGPYPGGYGSRPKAPALGSPHLGWGGRRHSGDGETPDTAAERKREAAERDRREAECEKARCRADRLCRDAIFEP